MKLTRHKWIVLGFVGILILSGFLLMAQANQGSAPPGDRSFGRHHGRAGASTMEEFGPWPSRRKGLGRLAEYLGLSDEQKEQIRQILSEGFAEVRPLMEQMRENRRALAETAAGSQFDEAAVAALATQQGELTAQMIVLKERTRWQVLSVLTDEQKAKATELHQMMKAMRGFGAGQLGDWLPGF